MSYSLSFFCDECGAANVTQATHCSVCKLPLLSSSVRTVTEQDTRVSPVALTVASDVLPINSLGGRYNMISQVGQGGFGVVYKAREVSTKKLVAIKQINLRSLGTRKIIEVTDSYNREVTMLSKLQHRCLPRIYDHFTDPEHWYLVMDFIEGETLEDALERVLERGLPVKEVLEIGVDLCSVLGYLHMQIPPIIFRDVKPGNIMRTPQGRLYLIDFGIARSFVPGQSKDTEPLGSPGYAAPEQYGRAQSTVQTDIYGLGATLKALLIGKDFSGIFTEERQISPRQNIPKKLQQLLDQMLETDANKRPGSVYEIKQQFQGIQEAMPGPRLIARSVRACFYGLLIGSMPYPLLGLAFALINTQLGYIVALPFYILVVLLLSVWPLVLIGQIALGIFLLFHSRSRLIGVGLLVMLAILVCLIAVGWLPSPAAVINGMGE